MTMLRTTRLLVPAAAVLLALLGPVPARAAGFSTEPVQVAPTSTAQTVVSDLAVGRHAGYDRLVLTFSGPLPGYSVAYVPQVTQDGSGRPVALQGSAFVAITLQPTSTATPAPQARTSPHFPMLREVTGAGDFEAVASYGVGLAGRFGMRVLTLTSPNRLVVDFAVPAGATRSVAPLTGASPTTAAAPAESPSAVAPVTPAEPAGAAAANQTAPAGGDATEAEPAGGPAPGSDTGLPIIPLAGAGAGLAVLGLGCYLLFRRRPA